MKIISWLAGCAATLVAALCFAALASSGLHLAEGRVVEGFDTSMRTLFAPFEPPLGQAVRSAGAVLGQDVHVHAQWKYAFVLLWLYFGSLASIWWHAGGRGAAIFSIVWGGVVALAGGLMFGTVGIDPPSSHFLANALLGSVPLAAYALFTLGLSAWAATFLDREGRNWFVAFVSWASGDMKLVAVGLAILGASLLAVGLANQTIPNIGLILGGAFAALLSLYLVVVGIRDARPLRSDGESWIGAFARMQSPRIGMLVISSLGGAAAVLAWGGHL